MSDRNPRGRFAAGNRAGRGRIVGSENKTTTDFRKIKEQLAGSYDRVDGDAIFDRLAREQPAVWCSLIVKLIPKEADLHVDHPDPLGMSGPGSSSDPIRDVFHAQLVELAGAGPITADVVQRQLEVNKRNRNGWRRPLPAGENHGTIEKRTEPLQSDA